MLKIIKKYIEFIGDSVTGDTEGFKFFFDPFVLLIPVLFLDPFSLRPPHLRLFFP